MGRWAVSSIQVGMATTWEWSPQEWEACPGSHRSQLVPGFSLLTCSLPIPLHLFLPCPVFETCASLPSSAYLSHLWHLHLCLVPDIYTAAPWRLHISVPSLLFTYLSPLEYQSPSSHSMGQSLGSQLYGVTDSPTIAMAPNTGCLC